jgi:3-hydroxymyristoyl/3-hydroxydecanoyl-(acyl carrier protein) dehydratase
LSKAFLDGLFEVVSREKNSSCVKLASDAHPVFAAHFESNPILPGFLYIDIIGELFGLEITEVKKAKYFEIVRPLELICVKLLKENDEYMSFEISKEEGVAASKIELKAKPR